MALLLSSLFILFRHLAGFYYTKHSLFQNWDVGIGYLAPLSCSLYVFKNVLLWGEVTLLICCLDTEKDKSLLKCSVNWSVERSAQPLTWEDTCLEKVSLSFCMSNRDGRQLAFVWFGHEHRIWLEKKKIYFSIQPSFYAYLLLN